jgi:predicted nucleic acid-binding protein
LAELKFGIENGQFRAVNRQYGGTLTNVLQLSLTDDLPNGAAQDVGEIKTALVRKCKTMGPYDMLIAAHARHIGATVVTHNERKFRRVPGLDGGKSQALHGNIRGLSIRTIPHACQRARKAMASFGASISRR